MENPKISIITITYNSEKTLEETILSVINQDYDNLEYLIIDGGSKDRTLDIVEKYREKISFVISEPDKGISDAFNKGIHYATGEIIGIINSDDLLCEDALKIIAENYEPGIDIYRGKTIIWNDATNSMVSAPPTMKFSLKDSIKAVNHQSTFVTKNAYNIYGTYNINYKYMMDVDLIQRMNIKGAKFKEIKEDLAIFRLGGVTSNDWTKKIQEIKDLVISNGGSNLLANYKVTKLWIKNIIKIIGYKTIGGGLTRKIFYKFK